MPANTQTNSAPQSRVQQLLLSLFFTAVAYSLGILAVSFTLRSPKGGGRLFAFWSATTGSTSLFIVLGFFITREQDVRTCRILLHLLVLLQIYGGVIFLPAELWEWFHLVTLYEALPTIGFIAIVLATFHYAIDCIYVSATTQAASSDEGFNIVTIFRRWIAHMSTSSRSDDQPVASTESIPLQYLDAEANTGNFQTRLLRMVQKMYHHRLPAVIDRLGEGPSS